MKFVIYVFFLLPHPPSFSHLTSVQLFEQLYLLLNQTQNYKQDNKKVRKKESKKKEAEEKKEETTFYAGYFTLRGSDSHCDQQTANITVV